MEAKYNEEFYTKFRHFVKEYMHFMYRIEANGLDNVDLTNTTLLAGNHLNILDSWLLAALLDDNLRFMVDKKLYRYKLWEWFFTSVGTFPIDPNSSDLKAVRTAVNLLKDHNNVVIFPEGQTHRYEVDVPFKPGVAAIAKLGNATLQPFGINGSYVPGSKLQINFGEVIDLNQYDKREYDEVLETKVRSLQKRI